MGRKLKNMNAKNTKKSLIHENADANITCGFGDGDISRSRSRLTHGHTISQTVSSIIKIGRFEICENTEFVLQNYRTKTKTFYMHGIFHGMALFGA